MFYIYRQIMNGRAQSGLVGCASIDDYINNVIKKHELTRADKEADRINHVDYCDANTGPIFLTYRPNEKLAGIIKSIQENSKPYCDFTDENGIVNTVWEINDDDCIKEINGIFESIDSLYIADGHHRAASAVKVGLKRRQSNPGYTGNEEFNFFLAVLFPDEELSIWDYNRVVADLNGLTPDQYLARTAEIFDVAKADAPVAPKERHTFGMYLDGCWYRLAARPGTVDEADPVASLDVSVLQEKLLAPVLGIDDPRVSDRIDFVGGIRGLSELERRVDGGMAVAFSMCPTSIAELMAIADAGRLMPPKSTWFEPKLRSGLFIHDLSEANECI